MTNIIPHHEQPAYNGPTRAIINYSSQQINNGHSLPLASNSGTSADCNNSASTTTPNQVPVDYSTLNTIDGNYTAQSMFSAPTMSIQPTSFTKSHLINEGPFIVGDEQSAKQRREDLSRRPSYRKILNDLTGLGGPPDPQLTQMMTNTTLNHQPQQQPSQQLQHQPQPLQPSQQSHHHQHHHHQQNQAPQQSQLLNSHPQTSQLIQTQEQLPVRHHESNVLQHHHHTQVLVQPQSQAQNIDYQIQSQQHPNQKANLTVSPSVNGGIEGDEVNKKREIRLQKNREAAKECRRKKKEYIKCLENRVSVLEAQNKALIDELKTLKDLYCKSAND